MTGPSAITSNNPNANTPPTHIRITCIMPLPALH